MKKTRRNRWIPMLMGLSQALLTGFVIYWLVGQFKSERESLQKELHFEFVQAQDQAMDSSLQLMLQPLLKDSLVFVDSLHHGGWISSTNNAFDSLHVSSNFSTDGPVGDKIIQFDIRGDHSSSTSNSATYEITSIPNQDAVLRGVKMIIEMSDDSVGANGHNSFTSFKVDSALLLNFASKRIKNIDHADFNILWYEDSLTHQADVQGKRIRFHSSLSQPPMIYEVADYEPFIIRKIIPQILFGLLLLILTGSAFIFTYRSLRKQILLNTLRNEFISNVSHELKTPVSTVKVALESLQNYDLKQDAKVSEEYLKMASLEMDRLDLLIQKILNQSLLESKKLLISKQHTDLILLCENVVQSLSPRVNDLNGKILFNPNNEVLMVNCDELYIQGVIINLLDNALKYGGTPPEIGLEISVDNGQCKLSVIDNGQGIPAEYHQKVFDRFFRVPTGDTHNVKGYGLGLSFAEEVMNQHGGSIDLDMHSNGGCIFTLIFPKEDEA